LNNNEITELIHNIEGKMQWFRHFLSKIYESVVNKRNCKFQNAIIYPPDNIPSNEKFFKVRYKAKIISIGNLSAGGTGKTPLVIEIINNYLPKIKQYALLGVIIKQNQAMMMSLQVLMKMAIEHLLHY